MKQNNMIAMILAGGRGSRLFDLTKKVAKPAVYFGGKYRIIDFPLSNCANSSINIVGVLTQYESVLLNSYVAKDQNWGLDAKDSGVYVLPPKETDEEKLQEYRGTADAITQNLDFLDLMNAEYVLILSGDHIYKMDYSKMLEYHISKNAEATIAVLGVDIKEASRFGIMNTDKDDMIIEFEEKPEHPKSNLASMGIYIFNYKTLKKYLNADKKDDNSNHDFGKDIIPNYLKDNRRLAAYRFEGYWKDVGTVDSLWEANLDLLNPNYESLINDPNWKIYTENKNAFPQFIGEDAIVSDSLINEGSIIDGEVKHSVIFGGVVIEKGAKIINSVILPNARICAKTVVNRCIVGEDVTIGKNKKVGSSNSEHIELISKNIG